MKWSESLWLTAGEEELFYPTLYEIGPGATDGSARFVLFHTASQGGDFRRSNDARLVRRTLEIRPGGAGAGAGGVTSP